jgi:uncharacterized protein YceK
MRLKIVALVAIAIMGLSLSGCPAVMVGNLAYQGYKHEHESPTPTPSSGSGASQSHSVE